MGACEARCVGEGADVSLRVTELVAAWDEREFERSAASVLSEGNGPVGTHVGSSEPCGERAETPTPDDARVQGAGVNARRLRCNERLKWPGDEYGG